MKLEGIRNKIDKIDRELLVLLQERMGLALLSRKYQESAAESKQEEERSPQTLPRAITQFQPVDHRAQQCRSSECRQHPGPNPDFPTVRPPVLLQVHDTNQCSEAQEGISCSSGEFGW